MVISKRATDSTGSPLTNVQLHGKNTADTTQIQATRKAFAGRLSRKLGLPDTIVRLSVEMALGGAHV